MGGFTLGIDVGTSTVSLAVWDPDARRVVDTETRALGQAGATELDPAKVLGTVRAGLDALGRGTHGAVSAVACTGQMHGVMVTDAAGDPLGPFVTWQHTRASEPAARADRVLEARQPGGWRARGCRLHPGYGAATLAYLAEPGLPTGARWALPLADWVANRLCGVVATDPSQAASWGVLDLRTRAWDIEAARAVGVPVHLLPPIHEPGSVLGRADLGTIGKGVAVATGMGDNQASVHAAALDAGADCCVVNVGTGSQVSRVVEGIPEELPEGLELRPYIGRRHLLVGASPNGGAAYALLARLLGLSRDSYEIMDRWAAEVSPGCDGLVCDVSFQAERDEPDRRGSFTGLRPQTMTAGHLCRAVLEGVADRLREIRDSVGCAGGSVVGSGNMVRSSALFRDILGRALGTVIALPPNREEAAVGAAMIAAKALG